MTPAKLPEHRTQMMDRATLRALFERHGEGELFGWADEVLRRIEGRAANHQRPPPPMHLVTGDLVVQQLELRSPFVLAIDGNLRLADDLDLSTQAYDSSLFIVMGDVEARNLRFAAGAAVYVKHRVLLAGSCFGDHGDEGAELYCELLRAEGVLLDHVTCANAREFDAVVCANADFGMPQHLEERASHPDVFVPEVLDPSGRVKVEAAWTFARGGRSVFQPGAVARLRASSPVDAPRVKPQ